MTRELLCEISDCEKLAIARSGFELFVGNRNLCPAHMAESLAYDQAGHVVVALALGHECTEVKLELNEDFLRHRCLIPPRRVAVQMYVSNRAGAFRARSESELEAARRQAFEKTAIVAVCAGDVAVDRFVGTPPFDESQTPHTTLALEQFSSRVRRIDPDGQEWFGEDAVIWLKQARLRAETILRQPKHWRAVERLADALLEQQELSASEIERLIEEAHKARPTRQRKTVGLSPLIERQLRELLGRDDEQ